MPSGRTHAKITAAAAGVLLLASPVLVQADPGSLAMIPGCLAGLFLGPDLDVDRGNYSEEEIKRMGGPAGGCLAGAWKAFWKPYALLIHHRSWISHGCLIGTLIRLGYVYILTVGFCVIGAGIPSLPLFWYFALGLAISDGLHILADRLF